MGQVLAIGVSVRQARSWGAPVPGMRGGTPWLPSRGVACVSISGIKAIGPPRIEG